MVIYLAEWIKVTSILTERCLLNPYRGANWQSNAPTLFVHCT